MRRRLDLSAGLIGRPPVILLDEPTTGLDPRSRQELWSIVEELRRERTTVLLTTQYLEEADRLAQQIAVVDRGRIAAQGTAAQLKAMIGGNVLRVRLAIASDLPGASAALAGLAAGDPPRVDTAAPRSASRWPTRPHRRRRSGAWTPGGCRSSPSSWNSPASTTCSSPSPDTARVTNRQSIHEYRRRYEHEHRNPRHTRTRPRHPGRNRGRQPRDGRPPAAQDPAQTDVHRLFVRAAGDLRAAVPLRVRRGDQHRPCELRQLPHARDHRHDGDLRRADDGSGTHRGSRRRRRRPLSLAADRPLGRAHRPDRRRPGDEPRQPDGDAAHRPCRRLPAQPTGLRGRARLRAGPGLCVCVLLDQKFVGVSVRDPETAQSIGFIWVFPLVFASSAFVPTSSMPGIMHTLADINPVSLVVNAARALTIGDGHALAPTLGTLAWLGGLLLVFVPLAVRGFRQA